MTDDRGAELYRQAEQKAREMQDPTWALDKPVPEHVWLMVPDAWRRENARLLENARMVGHVYRAKS